MSNRQIRNEYEDLIKNINVQDLQKQLQEKIQAREFKTSLMEKTYLLNEGVQSLSLEVEKTIRYLEVNNKINCDENLENELLEVFNKVMDLSDLLNIDIIEKAKNYKNSEEIENTEE